jgi:hypothetical protein
MTERDEFGLDQILDTVRKADRAEAERAWERFGRDRPQILQEVLARLDDDKSSNKATKQWRVNSPTSGSLKLIRNPKSVDLRWLKMVAASEGLNRLDAIREQVGAAFEAEGRIPMGDYSGELYVESQNSALLTFSRAGQRTTELDGKTVEFYRIEDTANRFSVTVEEDEIVIDFERLGISIEAYTEVGFRIHLDESTTIEGKLSHESGKSL